jgi:hypothetical protein
MNNECKIKDDDEIIEEEKQRYNFRRFTPEEINIKNSPFERLKKKEYPFLFQKKKILPKELNSLLSISLNDIIEKVKDLSFNSILYSPKTPVYPPSPLFDLSGNFISEMPTLKLEPIMDVDEQK